MAATPCLSVAVLPGDGIGPEITPPCLSLLERAAARAGAPRLRFETLAAGAACYRETGEALPVESRRRAAAADAILLAAMGLPGVRYPDGTEIAPQLELRSALDLYAGVRPLRALPGIPPVLADPRARHLDLVLVRESTEGLFASRGKGTVLGEREARDTLVVTRRGCQRLFEFAFRLARRRRREGHPGRVTCVDKANVFRSFAFFRRVFDQCAERFPDVEREHRYVDAMALELVRRPWAYDVLVTENMFGDILSDLGAGLIGGMGMAPSADIGARHAVFQPAHGSAPDIAGSGRANPTAMFLSGAQMLEWLGETRALPACRRAGALLRGAVEAAFAGARLRPCELGGEDGVAAISAAVGEALERLDPQRVALSDA